MKDFASKKVLIIGCGLSGAALAELLGALGAEVTLADQKELPESAIPGKIRDKVRAVLTGEGFPRSPEGFDALALSPGVPIDHPLVREARKLRIKVTGELELASRSLPFPFSAVTGSNGKTTTASLTAHILERLGFRPWLGGNIGKPVAGLAAEYAEGKAAPYRTGVIEVSSFQLETVSKFHARGAALLNLTPDHLDRHGTMREYLKMKQRIFLNQDESDTAVLNLDDDALRGMKQRARVFGFSRRRRPADYGAWVFKKGEEERLTVIENGREAASVPTSRFSLFGAHNQENLMAALGLASALGADFQEALEAARDFSVSDHRLQLVGSYDGVSYYDDSKGTNTGAVMTALSNFRNRSVILIMGGRDKDMDFRPLTDRVREKVKRLVLMGETRDKLKGVLAGLAPIVFAETMGEAVEVSREAALPGDTVLLSPACASFDMFKDYKERGDVFQKEVLRVNGQEPPAEVREGA